VIEWWGWLLIWAGLVLALLVLLAVLAFRLFRQATALMRELSVLVDKASALGVENAELSAPQIAVLAEISEIRAQHETQRRRRLELKHGRHGRRMERAKRIMLLDASTAKWPEGWL
jgi:hypothetical protein